MADRPAEANNRTHIGDWDADTVARQFYQAYLPEFKPAYVFIICAIISLFITKEIKSFLKSKLEPYKVPAFIEQIDEIPRTFNGKILRKNLK